MSIVWHEITQQTIAETFRFTNVDKPPCGIEHSIDTRKLRRISRNQPPQLMGLFRLNAAQRRNGEGDQRIIAKLHKGLMPICVHAFLVNAETTLTTQALLCPLGKNPSIARRVAVHKSGYYKVRLGLRFFSSARESLR